MLRTRRETALLFRDRRREQRIRCTAADGDVNAVPVARIRPRQRYAWRGTSLLATDERGECGVHDGLTGYYFREARHLRTLRLEVNGASPWLCAEGSSSHDELALVYVYPELTRFGGGGTDVSDDTTSTDDHGVNQRAIDLRLRYVVRLDGLDVELLLTNRSREPAKLEVAWIVDADFADIQEAHAAVRQQNADVRAGHAGATMRFLYRHPDLSLETRIVTQGNGTWSATDAHRMVGQLRLYPRQSERVALRIEAIDSSNRQHAVDVAQRLSHIARWRERLTRVEIPEARAIEQVIRQASDDLASLALLDGAEDEWLAIQAGIPLYPALFGRDTITVGWQAAMLDRGAVLDASLTRLRRMQSDRVDEFRDEEPGRIPFQVRQGPLARLALNPHGASYADFASPLMFVISLAHLFAWTGDKTGIARHWDAARRILDWAREYGDRDGDGYLEYLTRSSAGTKNQGWKDSGNAILYEDGRPVPAPLGTCEIQGYWFAAQQLMAVLSWVMGEHDNARDLWRSASDLKTRFNRDWWMADEAFVALARDADKRLARSITSNVGHCLAAGIIDDEHVPPVVGRLFAPDMFSGWGIRTLSTEHPSYNPLSYHLGTVWSVENATIAFGLRRYGFDSRALDLARSTFDLASLYERGRIPECVGGYARSEFPHPGAYPRANPIQAWNQSAMFLFLHSILGLQPVAALDLLVIDPVLPTWMPEVILHDLRLGGTVATVRFWRDKEGESHGEVVRKRGPLKLIRQPPPESLYAGVRDRFGALADSLLHH
jgi:glycogen debranching enzyme